MNWIATTILCIVVIEVVVRIPFAGVFRGFVLVSWKALHVLGAKRVSDHWKEKALLAYACSLFTYSIRLAAFLIIVGVAAALVVLAADHLGATASEFVFSWLGICYSVVAGTVYFFVRKLFA